MNIDKLLHYFNQKNFAHVVELLKSINFHEEKNYKFAFLLSLSFFNLGKYENSLKYINIALSKEKNNSEIFFNKGIVLEKLNLIDDSLVCYLKAIEINNNNIQALNNVALIFYKRKKYFLSIKYFKLSISKDNKFWQAYYNIGLLYIEIRKFKLALINFIKVKDLIPKNSNAYVYVFIGDCYYKTKFYEEAYKNYLNAISINPHLFEAYNGIANYFYEKNQLLLAKKNYEKAISINSNFSKAFYNLGKINKEFQNFEKAISCFDKAIELNPNYKLAKFAKSTCFLYLRNFVQGWQYYEFREHENYLEKILKRYPEKIYKKNNYLHNKKILIISEQGFGDTIQFCRYIKNLLILGCVIDFKPQKQLFKLMSLLEDNINIISELNDIEKYDYIIPLMSIPYILDINPDNDIQNEKYIKPNRKNIMKWKNKINPNSFNIGINWQGSKTEADKDRSFSLKYFEEISKFKNLQLISLQKFEGIEQLDKFKGDIKTFDKELDNEFPFFDTAALLSSLDLVITSDTSIAHLAGAVGCKTWVVLQKTPDWRWGVNINSSPYYKDMVLYRQKDFNDWSFPFLNMQRELQNE